MEPHLAPTSISSTQTVLETSSQSFSPLPKRSGSLRKATLQQRHEKPLRLRAGAEGNDAQSPNPPLRNRLRLSLDNPQQNRESPVSHQGNQPNILVHPMAAHRRDGPPHAQRHPLSRTITQSSSGSSFVEDSPTHVPIRHAEPRLARLDFSKSLPLHALRPPGAPSPASGPSSQESFATPENYKLAKPLPAAFMSTGLISKKAKNLDQAQLDAKGSIGHMPDTPCKRPVSLVALSPSAAFPSKEGQARPNRHTMHSFGTPSTPFNPNAFAQEAVRRGSTVFGESFSTNGPRRGSLLSTDVMGADASPSSHASVRRTGSRFEPPPTPTKQVGPLPDQPFSFGFKPEASMEHQDAEQSPSSSQRAHFHAPSFFESSSEDETETASCWDDVQPPFSAQRQRSMSSHNLAEGDGERLLQAQSPTPRSRHFHTLPLSRRRGVRNQTVHQNRDSPIFDRSIRFSPKTPADMIPPDPSGLSISANAKSQSLFAENIAQARLSLPPVTPTANRDSFPRMARQRPALTPVHHPSSADIDESITSRFDKADLVGTGEFSLVFRVVRQREPDSGSSGYFGAVNCGNTQERTPAVNRVWAVKKARNAYLGQRDRHRKLQEVEILKQIGRSDHTIRYDHSWEYGNHLYIQTEYCDEGSLDVFLNRVGRNARLDDFRIWKVLLELAQVRCPLVEHDRR